MAKIQKRTSREARKPKQVKKTPIASTAAGDAPTSVRAALSAAGPDRKKPRA